ERSIALQELTLQQELLRSMTDSIPALVSFVGSDERYQYCNKTYLDVFGVERKDMVGKSLLEFLGEEFYRIAKPSVDRALAGETTRFERPVTAKGKTLYIEGAYVPQ